MGMKAVIPGGAKAIVHVHQAKIRKDEDAVIVRRRGKSQHYRKIRILGPAILVQNTEPDSCGARVWIETLADIEVLA